MRHLGFLPCAATIIKPQVVSNYNYIIAQMF